MNIAKVTENIGTSLKLKRIASAYVIDYRNLSDDEIKAALLKTSPQYSFQANVEKNIRELFLASDRKTRIISRLLLKNVLLQKDDFMCPEKETEDDVLAFEQSIVNESNEALLQKSNEKSKCIELFQFILETAWQHNDSISPDEKNLIEKIKNRLKITDKEYYIIEAKLGKFPKTGNELHTRVEIEEVRRDMQSRGLLFSLRDSDNADYDIIPSEIAKTVRQVLSIEMRDHGYKVLLAHKTVRSKSYYQDILSNVKSVWISIRQWNHFRML